MNSEIVRAEIVVLSERENADMTDGNIAVG
jgi:hypothetical protein